MSFEQGKKQIDDLQKRADEQEQLQTYQERVAKERRNKWRMSLPVLPKNMEALAMNAIKETEIMLFPQDAAIEYVENITKHRISINRFYDLKNKIHIETTEWFINFSTGVGDGSFLHFFRERLFIFQDILQKTIRQMNLELTTRPHEQQNHRRIHTLTEDAIQLNVLLAQFGMSTPVMVAMKLVNDPQFKDLKNIITAEERNKLIINFRKKLEDNIKYNVEKVDPDNPKEKDLTNYKRSSINELNRKIGFGIAERSSNIQLDKIYEDNSSTEYSHSLPDSGSGTPTENRTETKDAGSDVSEGEREYRRQKDKAVF